MKQNILELILLISAITLIMVAFYHASNDINEKSYNTATNKIQNERKNLLR